ncbi:uncharacterized protein TRIADDRAFT_59196 [Trichoplax adhaerens]|uniref:RING-type domain-containing protein n=1 Tax=Trichoplax adhaerens TaxID=10228 RepID=B3S550_TRIAD|nr:hypothetical protein TRIADDRAFT_59196 [Trichoplax adhaerens]EDV22072.1 hypothetical protein TRIADDRAFT_59196 [Trichoplax adhaerens]|eukprot:XP_002115227.1 hypothetical protein TRIADDRAFT_59196 [Trichoplax adhaerens]
MSENTEESDEIDSESVELELEMLKEIYINELQVEQQCSNQVAIRLIFQLNPGTGDDASKQYVRLKLVIDIPLKYPIESPIFKIENPRGLSEAHIASILANCTELAKSREGELILLELVEYVKDSLTANNIPICKCAICLRHFMDASNFIKTDCYHYFHNACIMRYKRHQDDNNEELLCPICREPLDNIDLDAFKNLSLKDGDQTEEDDSEYVHSKDFKLWQQETAKIYQKQLENGGIIDLEKEKKRFLVTEATTLSPTSKQVVKSGDDSRAELNTSYDRVYETPRKEDFKVEDRISKTLPRKNITESHSYQSFNRSHKRHYRWTSKNDYVRSEAEVNRDNNLTRSEFHTPSKHNSPPARSGQATNRVFDDHSSKSSRYRGNKGDKKHYRSPNHSNESKDQNL